MSYNEPKIPVKHDMRAICHLAASVLKNSNRPVCDEVAETLQEATGSWIERLEYLEEKLQKYSKLLHKIENESAEGLAPFMEESEYEAFYQNSY